MLLNTNNLYLLTLFIWTVIFYRNIKHITDNINKLFDIYKSFVAFEKTLKHLLL